MEQGQPLINKQIQSVIRSTIEDALVHRERLLRIIVGTVHSKLVSLFLSTEWSAFYGNPGPNLVQVALVALQHCPLYPS